MEYQLYIYITTYDPFHLPSTFETRQFYQLHRNTHLDTLLHYKPRQTGRGEVRKYLEMPEKMLKAHISFAVRRSRNSGSNLGCLLVCVRCRPSSKPKGLSASLTKYNRFKSVTRFTHPHFSHIITLVGNKRTCKVRNETMWLARTL